MRMTKEEAIEHYNLSPEEVYGEPDYGECEQCGGILAPNGSDNYGSDRDGRRGRKLYYYQCNSCGEEHESFGC